MRLHRSLIGLCLIASALASTTSCAGRDARVAGFLPAPPADAFRREAEPRFTVGDAASERAYEAKVSDKIDWGKRADITVWRGCSWINAFLEVKLDCGPPPRAE